MLKQLWLFSLNFTAEVFLFAFATIDPDGSFTCRFLTDFKKEWDFQLVSYFFQCLYIDYSSISGSIYIIIYALCRGYLQSGPYIFYKIWLEVLDLAAKKLITLPNVSLIAHSAGISLSISRFNYMIRYSLDRRHNIISNSHDQGLIVGTKAV